MLDTIINSILPNLSIQLQDVGIGPYECWGKKGVDKSIQPVIQHGEVEVVFDSSFGSISDIILDLPRSASFFQEVEGKDKKMVDVMVEVKRIGYLVSCKEGKVTATYIWGE
jgi:hypothetical protein